MRVDHQVLAPVIAQLHDVAPEGVIQGTGSEGVWVHPPHHTGSFVDPGRLTLRTPYLGSRRCVWITKSSRL